MKTTWPRRIRCLPAVMLSAMVSSALAQPPDMNKVLISFKNKLWPTKEALVHAKGGEIKYTIVPAIAATVPSQALDGLCRNPNVTAVVPDLEVHEAI